MTRRALLLSLVLLAFLQAGIVYVGGAASTDCGTANRLYEVTFNTNEGDADCTNHGATATDTARFDCADTGDPQEGTAQLTHDGGGSGQTTTAWDDVFGSGYRDLWAKFYVRMDENLTGSANLFEWTGAGGGILDIGYSGEAFLRVGTPATDLWFIFSLIPTPCDAANAYVDQTWDEYIYRFSVNAGDSWLWIDGGDGFAGAADWSCDATATSPRDIRGFRLIGASTVDSIKWDRIIICDGDPR